MRHSGMRVLALAMLALVQPAAARQDSAAISIRISLAVRQLWVLDAAGDTMFSTSIAVGSGSTLATGEQSWTFRTPTGQTRVTAKQKDPVWIPPDWHYAELAKKRGLELAWLPLDMPVQLSSGRSLMIRGARVGLIDADSTFTPLIATEEIVFDNTLFIPPFGTEQRRVAGVLGPYRLLLANGVGLHGTNDQTSIGRAVTHGCIRLRDDAITWLYENVPVGASVLIY
jgi:hypothetical protein